MSSEREQYVDVTTNPVQKTNPPSKAEEAEADRTHGNPTMDTSPPIYSPASSSSTAPPAYSLVDDVSASIRSLREGDPKETISVPMIHSTETRNYKKLLSKDRKTVTQTVIVRKMPREYYLKHYAKDVEGNYVGTEKPAADAGLVFVPSKSTPEDILEQVHKVAFGKMHSPMDFSTGGNMLPLMMVPIAGFGG
ncbi:hypothetical protein P280DRAFT_468498 [Massarina eburnea CBS 473.64]|uniref:Uncharacterized protein n=1 Tax=Massarina eburnea CBS 473.64 TaxID=1395130 RepID=A0A6A6S6H6_9PLEO|nr:hypothetical protein P280DRAFT_468498 [Massarina eburnea CBS 473.64]